MCGTAGPWAPPGVPSAVAGVVPFGDTEIDHPVGATAPLFSGTHRSVTKRWDHSIIAHANAPVRATDPAHCDALPPALTRT